MKDRGYDTGYASVRTLILYSYVWIQKKSASLLYLFISCSFPVLFSVLPLAAFSNILLESFVQSGLRTSNTYSLFQFKYLRPFCILCAFTSWNLYLNSFPSYIRILNIPVNPSEQRIRISCTPLFFRAFSTDSQYLLLSFSPITKDRTSFFSSRLIPSTA